MEKDRNLAIVEVVDCGRGEHMVPLFSRPRRRHPMYTPPVWHPHHTRRPPARPSADKLLLSPRPPFSPASRPPIAERSTFSAWPAGLEAKPDTRRFRSQRLVQTTSPLLIVNLPFPRFLAAAGDGFPFFRKFYYSRGGSHNRHFGWMAMNAKTARGDGREAG